MGSNSVMSMHDDHIEWWFTIKSYDLTFVLLILWFNFVRHFLQLPAQIGFCLDQGGNKFEKT